MILSRELSLAQALRWAHNDVGSTPNQVNAFLVNDLY